MHITIKWSAQRIPNIGDRFISEIPYFPPAGKGSVEHVPMGTYIPHGEPMQVTGFDVEHGYLYAIARPVRFLGLPAWEVYVAGCDVEAWGGRGERAAQPDVGSADEDFPVPDHA